MAAYELHHAETKQGAAPSCPDNRHDRRPAGIRWAGRSGLIVPSGKDYVGRSGMSDLRSFGINSGFFSTSNIRLTANSAKDDECIGPKRIESKMLLKDQVWRGSI
jgi:hypothetical protein